MLIGPLLNKKQVLFLVLNVIVTYNSFINYIDLLFVDIDIDINEPISIIENVALCITKQSSVIPMYKPNKNLNKYILI